jgi:hypothetical protein
MRVPFNKRMARRLTIYFFMAEDIFLVFSNSETNLFKKCG